MVAPSHDVDPIAGRNSSQNEAVEREYVSPREFVAQSGVSLPTVRRYLRNGRLPFIQPGGPHCRVLIPRSALKRFGTVIAVTSTSEANQSPSVAAPPSVRRKPLPGPNAKWRSQN